MLIINSMLLALVAWLVIRLIPVSIIMDYGAAVVLIGVLASYIMTVIALLRPGK